MLLPLVTPELVFAVGMFLLFTTAFGFIGLGTTGAGDRARDVLAVVGRADRARAAGDDRARRRGGGGRPRRAAVGGRCGASCCRCWRPAMAAGLLVASRSRSTTSSSRSTWPRGADTTTVPMRIYAQARNAPTPALNALATIMLVVSLLALVLAWLVFRRLSRGQDGAAIDDVRGGGGCSEPRRDRARRAGQALRRRAGRRRRRRRHIPGGEFFTHARPVGLRQDDDAAADRRASSSSTRARSCSTASTCRARRRTSGRSTRSSSPTRCSRT